MYSVLIKLKTDKAPVTDGIPSQLFRIRAVGISFSWSALFNDSFESADFSAVRKNALVAPIFKKKRKKERQQKFSWELPPYCTLTDIEQQGIRVHCP